MALAPSYDRVLIAASADGGTFGQAPGLLLTIDDASGSNIASFEILDAATETAFVFGEFYRRDGGWKFRAIGQGYASGLKGLAVDFGITVEDDAPGEPPQPIPRPPTVSGTPATPPAKEQLSPGRSGCRSTCANGFPYANSRLRSRWSRRVRPR